MQLYFNMNVITLSGKLFFLIQRGNDYDRIRNIGINNLYNCGSDRSYFRPFTLLVVGKMNQRIITGRRNKYRNKKCEFNGYKFDSVKEMLRYQDLAIMEAGNAGRYQIFQPYESVTQLARTETWERQKKAYKYNYAARRVA